MAAGLFTLDVERRSGALLHQVGGQFGTGFLVRARDFFEGAPDTLLLLTNAHVLSQREPGALRPTDAYVRFEGLDHAAWRP